MLKLFSAGDYINVVLVFSSVEEAIITIESNNENKNNKNKIIMIISEDLPITG